MSASDKAAADTERLRSTLASVGLHGALAWLNSRTTFRYTGIYHLEDGFMRMVAMFDRDGEDIKALTVIPFGDSFCQFVMRDGVFNTVHTAEDSRLIGHAYRDIVASYFGLPLASGPGDFYGTLCHFDLVPKAVADEEIEFLYGVAPLLMAHLKRM